jgi:hypothetical protein
VRRWPAAALACGLALVLAAPAAAERAWFLRVSPAVWAPSLDAEARFRDRRVAATDAAGLAEPDPVAFVDGELRWRRLGVLVDVAVIDVEESASAGPVTADLDVAGVLAAVSGFWRLADRERWSVDALAGARYWSIDTEFAVRGAGSAEGGQRWADPLVGARAALRLGRRWDLQVMGDVGGFGVGADLQWEVVGRAAFAVTERVAVAAGWRHLAFDYEEDGFALDASLTGPFLAVDFRF